MEEKEKSAQIERIRLQLEKKLQEIENRKKAATLKKEIKPTKKEEKTLFELRKELQELQKTKNVLAEDKKNVEKKSITSSLQSKVSEKPIVSDNKTTTESVSKLKNEDKSTIITPDSKEILKEKEVEIKENNKTTSKTVTKKGVNPIVPLKKEKETPKPISTTKRVVNSKKSNQKEGTIARNKIIFIIAFTFALLYLGYLFKLKIDLNKEKEALEKKKLEQIDYSKDDAIFKEVEEDPAPEELQDIK